MKTIITLLTTTMLVAGAASAMASDRQATDDAIANASTWQAVRDGNSAGSYAQATRSQGLVYAPRHRSHR